MFKRSTIVLFVIIFMAFSLSGFTAASAAQKGKSPDPKMVNQQAWERLGKTQTLGQVRMVQLGGKGAPLQVEMAKIKGALEKAGVNEPVAIFFADLNGKLFSNLGSYKPDKIGVKRQAPAGNSSSSAQPTTFSAMPPYQPLQTPTTALPGNRGIKMRPGMVYNSKVVFKDGMGTVKAILLVQISVPDSQTTAQGKKEGE